MTCECIAGSPYTRKQMGLTQLRELPSGDCAETEARLAAKHAELAEATESLAGAEAKLAEAEAKLKECKEDACPEATVVSLGGETVFTGTSCDTMTGLGGDVVTGTEDVAVPGSLESETLAVLE